MHKQPDSKNIATLGLALGALGVVYGDIGTSPLYAVREIFFGHAHLPVNPENIFGVISVIFWAITLIVSFKYVVFVLRADNDGEGGVFALYGLLQKYRTKGTMIIGFLLLLAAGLLFGDGIITPAISVISAVEGLNEATTAFTPFVVPITIAILTGLFMIQKYGTHKIGKFFGPIILLWFIAISFIGGYYVLQHLEILQAINPGFALVFIEHNPLHTLFLVLGSVMLVVTGGEAMYADLGHFGKNPIRLSWFLVAYPALLINYFGQGAYLLDHLTAHSSSIFFGMVPSWGLYPMVILATLATIIASQALITGAFSLASQAISLRLLPYLATVHTHHEHEGQIYVPMVNWLLFAGCVTLVIVFHSSSNLASAYGLAVSGVMLVTTLGMFGIAKHYWHWKNWRTIVLFTPLAFIDLTFLFANSLKFLEGGYLPMVIGLFVLYVMATWEWGYSKLASGMEHQHTMTMRDLVAMRKTARHIIPRSVLMISPYPVHSFSANIPMAKQVFLDRYGLLPKHLVFVYLKNERVPHIHNGDRYAVKKFYENNGHGSIVSVEVRFGFMENPDLQLILRDIFAHKHVQIKDDPSTWLIHELRGMILPLGHANVFQRVRQALFKLLYQNTDRIDEFYGLGEQARVSLELLPARME